MTPSTMSPSLKYLIVWSIAARKSSAEPMSLIGDLGGAGRTDLSGGHVVGSSGRWMRRDRTPAVGDRGDEQRGEPARAVPVWGRARQTSGAFPSYGRRDRAVHQGAAPGDPPGVSRSARHEPASVPPPPLPLGSDGYPAAGGVARRPPAPRSRPGPTGAGGTPRRRPTSPSTGPTSATSTSSGAPRGCARPTRTCSATSPDGGSWRSAAARPRARAGCAAQAPTSSRSTSPPGCWPAPPS